MLILNIMNNTGYNCFALVAQLEPILSSQSCTAEDFDKLLVNFTNQLHNIGLNEAEMMVTKQSRTVYLEEMVEKETQAETIDEDDERDLINNGTSTFSITEEAVYETLKQIKNRARKRAFALKYRQLDCSVKSV